MIELSPIAIRHLAKAVADEIASLEQMGQRLGPSEDWPHDYDPNDLAMYRGALGWFQANLDTGPQMVDASSKPMRFIMSLVPHYVREKGHSLSSAELDGLYRAYAAFVASTCLAILPEMLKYPHSTAAEEIRKNLSRLVDFPGKK